MPFWIPHRFSFLHIIMKIKIPGVPCALSSMEFSHLDDDFRKKCFSFYSNVSKEDTLRLHFLFCCSGRNSLRHTFLYQLYYYITLWVWDSFILFAFIFLFTVYSKYAQQKYTKCFGSHTKGERKVNYYFSLVLVCWSCFAS